MRLIAAQKPYGRENSVHLSVRIIPGHKSNRLISGRFVPDHGDIRLNSTFSAARLRTGPKETAASWPIPDILLGSYQGTCLQSPESSHFLRVQRALLPQGALLEYQINRLAVNRKSLLKQKIFFIPGLQHISLIFYLQYVKLYMLLHAFPKSVTNVRAAARKPFIFDRLIRRALTLRIYIYPNFISLEKGQPDRPSSDTV